MKSVCYLIVYFDLRVRVDKESYFDWSELFITIMFGFLW